MEGFVLSLEFLSEKFPPLRDIASLFHDIELAHDFGALVSDPEHRDFKFNGFFWYKNGRVVPQSKRIRTARIVKESPLVLEVVIPTLGALWVLIQILVQVSDRPLLREKLEREVAKLRREEVAHRETVSDMHVEFMERLHNDHSARLIVERIEARIRENPIKILDANLGRFPPSSNDSEYEE